MRRPDFPATLVARRIGKRRVFVHRQQTVLLQGVMVYAACWNCCRYWFGDNSVCWRNNRAKKLASS